MVGEFSSGQQHWIDRLGNLRNVIRQEMIRRQLAEHARAGMTVLDVGCGQGTQAIELARIGCSVTGVEPSAELRAICRLAAADQAVEVELLAGSIEQLDSLLGARRFDLVCAHGVLMYLDDLPEAIRLLTGCIARGGLLSVTVRSGHALAMRPGMRREWARALESFGAVRYLNGLGVDARAHRLDEVVAEVQRNALELVEWYGVRVFNDAIAADFELPDGEDLAALLDAEEQAGRTDPYRILGSQLHVISRRLD